MVATSRRNLLLFAFPILLSATHAVYLFCGQFVIGAPQVFWSECKRVFIVKRYIADQLLNGKSTFTQESLDKYLVAMDKLNFIQEKLLKLKSEENGANKSEERGGEGGEVNTLTIEVGNFERFSTNYPVKRPDMTPYLFEGDIILTPKQVDELLNGMEHELQLKELKGLRKITGNTTVSREKRTLTSSLGVRWNKFPIPFTITNGVNSNAVLSGVNSWITSTCITFQQYTSLPAGPALEFIYGSGCYSNIGMNPYGAQQISIGEGCDIPAIVAHEIGHSLGYFHEQSRFDRDSYIGIQTEHIQPQFLSQFTKQAPQSMITYGVEYDLGSVMHYDPFGFSSDGQMDILTLDPNAQDTIGQRSGLSFNDVKKMNFAYCNQSCSVQLPCLRSGYTDPKSCSRCRCPDGLGGTLCDSVQQTSTNCGQLVLTANSNYTQTLSQRGSGSCNFIITAPDGVVAIAMDSINFIASTPCQSYSFVEVRYGTDIGNTGPRFCRRIADRQFTSQDTQSRDGASAPIQEAKDEEERVNASAPVGEEWSEWSKCSASCGGCGMQERRKLTGIEKRHCNEQPCPEDAGACCAPFYFVEPLNLCLKAAENNSTEEMSKADSETLFNLRIGGKDHDNQPTTPGFDELTAAALILGSSGESTLRSSSRNDIEVGEKAAKKQTEHSVGEVAD